MVPDLWQLGTIGRLENLIGEKMMLRCFPTGSVGQTLSQMAGVWHDRIEIYSPAGMPLEQDPASGTPGAAPYENLVYIEFDGEVYNQTNVCYRGRPLHERRFSGVLRNGVLYFDPLGSSAPQHVGVSGGPGILFFVPESWAEQALHRYAEPDCLRLTGPNSRTRTTVLYRDGQLIRTLTAFGQKLSPDGGRRWQGDPRGAEGPVHSLQRSTDVFQTPGAGRGKL